MDLELVKDIYDIHIRGFEGLGFDVIKKEKYEIIHNKNIKDCYSNYISNFDVKDKNEFKIIMADADKAFKEINRNNVVYLIPTMKNLYDNINVFFEAEKFDLISTDAWQIFNHFEKLDEIKTNCSFNVELELATDMKEYADYLMSCYQTFDEDDPYGELDDGYRKGYMNYKKIYDDIVNEFFYIKVDNKIVGTTQSVYNSKICGIYSLAIKKEYRNKGIGKEALKQQLQMCKNKNIDIVYLETELGFYPNQIYRKFGFEDLCEVFYFAKK